MLSKDPVTSPLQIDVAIRWLWLEGSWCESDT